MPMFRLTSWWWFKHGEAERLELEELGRRSDEAGFSAAEKAEVFALREQMRREIRTELRRVPLQVKVPS
jgi:hypothetical protein